MVKVAIVTGGNKGIGFHIVRGLCEKFEGHVYLTARDAGRGQAAVETLEKEGFSPKFHQLDVTDEESIKTLVDFINTTYGGLDVLVNNAGTIVGVDDPMTRGQEAEYTMNINYFGCINLTRHFLPTTRDGARIVHVSSTSGAVSYQFSTDELKSKILAITTVEEITDLMQTYTSSAKFGMEGKLGWPDSDESFDGDSRPWAYGVSKMGTTLHAILLQRQLDKQFKDVVINACCPGYCDTDMSNHKGTRPAAEGAAIALSLALIPPHAQSPRGKFKGADGKCVHDWYDIDLAPLNELREKRKQLQMDK